MVINRLYIAKESSIIWNNPEMWSKTDTISFSLENKLIIGTLNKNDVFIVINSIFTEVTDDNLDTLVREMVEVITSTGIHGWIVFYADYPNTYSTRLIPIL